MTIPAAARAQDCECQCPTDVMWEPFLDSRGSSEQAPNARLFARLDGYDVSTLRLVGVGDPAIVLELAGDGRASAFWITPEVPLASGSLYRMSVGSLDGARTFEATFTTSVSVDTSAPDVDEITVAAPPANRYCAHLIGGVVQVVAAPQPYNTVVTEVEVLRDGALVGRVFPVQGVFGTSSSPDCLGAGHLDGLVDGEPLTARVRLWDLAGNATEWVDVPFTAQSATAGSDAPCGRWCTASPRRAPLSALGIGCAVAIGLGVHRRTSRRSSQARRL